MGKPKRVRRQHVVSKFYLKGFAKAEQLTRVPLGGRPHIQNVSDATVVKDFYSVPTASGEVSDYFERSFAELEGVAARALAITLAGTQWPLDPADKLALATWIALQFLRTESVRNSGTEMNAQMIALVVGTSGKQALRAHIEAAEQSPISDARLDAEWADLTQHGGPQLAPDPVHHIRQVASLLPGTSLMFADKQWSLNCFPQPELVTSDHPVLLIPDASQDPWMGVGLANAAGYAIALSRHHGLVIGASPDLPDLRINTPPPQVARLLVRGTVASARKAVYHHPDDGHLLNGVQLPSPRTKEMRAPDISRFVREEGLFASFTAEHGSALSTPGDPDDSFTLADLTWPIPGRTPLAHAEASDT